MVQNVQGAVGSSRRDVEVLARCLLQGRGFECNLKDTLSKNMLL